MANTYKLTPSKIANTGSTVLYTAPALTTSLLKSIYISNITGSPAYVDIIVNKSGSATDYYLIASASIPVQTSFQPISDPIVLQTGDSIKLATTTANYVDAIVSYLEIT